MTVLASILGGAAFGFGTRCFQLGLQKKPIFSGPGGHLATSAAFGAAGYFMYQGDQRMVQMLKERKELLASHREAEGDMPGAVAPVS